MYEKRQLYVYDGANWECLGQQSISYSHGDDCGEQGDNGMKDGWSFSATSEPIKVCKKMKRLLHQMDSHSRKFNRQFEDLRCNPKYHYVIDAIKRCIKYGDKIPLKYRKRYGDLIHAIRNAYCV